MPCRVHLNRSCPSVEGSGFHNPMHPSCRQCCLQDLWCPMKEAAMADQPLSNAKLKRIMCTSADRCIQAAARGSLSRLQWLRSPGPCCPWNSKVCSAAARHGHLHILQHLRSCDPPCPWTAEVCTAAAGAGHLEILQWARAQGCSWELQTFEAAWQGR